MFKVGHGGYEDPSIVPHPKKFVNNNCTRWPSSSSLPRRKASARITLMLLAQDEKHFAMGFMEFINEPPRLAVYVAECCYAKGIKKLFVYTQGSAQRV